MGTNSEGRFVPGRVVSEPVERIDVETDTIVAAFAVHCKVAVLQALMSYAKQYPDTEVLGLLLGRVVQTNGGRIRTVVREFFTAGEYERSTLGSVVVGPSEFLRMYREYEDDAKQRGLRVVGWFHTHPGHGVFMSPTDRRTQAMFTYPWQIGIVLDPVHNTWGVFSGPECEKVAHFRCTSADEIPAEPTEPTSIRAESERGLFPADAGRAALKAARALLLGTGVFLLGTASSLLLALVGAFTKSGGRPRVIRDDEGDAGSHEPRL